VVGFLLIAIGCGGTNATTGETAPSEDTTAVESATPDATDSIAEEEMREALPAMVETGAVGSAAAALYGCDARACLMNQGAALMRAVYKATRTVNQSLTEVEDGCLRGALLEYRGAVKAFRTAALRAQGGQRQATLHGLDRASDLVFSARDGLLSCSTVWPGDVQLAALNLAGVTDAFYAIDDVMASCKTMACIRAQGRLMEREAGRALTAYQSLLTRFDVRAVPTRCQKVSGLSLKVLRGFKDYGTAVRKGELDRADALAERVYTDMVLRQGQLKRCVSG
jgi:hypothetical protein